MKKENESQKEYFVLSEGYKTASKTEQVFNSYKNFDTVNDARKYALAHLPAIVASKDCTLLADKTCLKNASTPYIVVAKHEWGLYSFGELDGHATEYHAQRCSADDLDSTVEKMIAQKNAVGTAFAGIELKLVG